MKSKYLFIKLLSRLRMVFGEFNNLRKHYSLVYAFYCLGWWLGFYSRNKKISLFFTSQKQTWLDCYIEKNYADIVNKYINKAESEINTSDFKLWCYWGQGEENMPPIVKACYIQMVQLNPGKVILLTNQNVRQYVELPDIIYKKLNEGTLLYAHFSDILRNSLLSKYGGLWLDVTCWTPCPIPSFMYDTIFISPHNESDGTYWCTYAMGSNKVGSVTFSFLREMLIEVCQKEKVWPDYLFQDRLLSFAHRKIKASKAAINMTPTNGTKRFLLYPLLNKPFSTQIYRQVIDSEWVFKLSYKSYYKKKIKDVPTFYGKIIDGTINEY